MTTGTKGEFVLVQPNPDTLGIDYQYGSHRRRVMTFAAKEQDAARLVRDSLEAAHAAGHHIAEQQAQAIIGGVHEAIGEDRNSDHDSLPETVRQIVADLREAMDRERKQAQGVVEALRRFLESSPCRNHCHPTDMTCDTNFARAALAEYGGGGANLVPALAAKCPTCGAEAQSVNITTRAAPGGLPAYAQRWTCLNGHEWK